MTKEKAIAILKESNVIDLANGNTPGREAVDMAIEALKAQEWIPCSKRLPSDSGNYLITGADFRLGYIGERIVTTADFYAKAKKWNSIVDVIAWMPLPEPYREKGE